MTSDPHRAYRRRRAWTDTDASGPTRRGATGRAATWRRAARRAWAVVIAASALLAGTAALDPPAAPAAAPLAWSAATVPGATQLSSVSCASEALCVAADRRGAVFTSGDPLAPTPAWGETSLGSAPLSGVGCAAPATCVAVAANGEAFGTQGGGWSAQPTGATALTGVSCASQTLCMAVDEAGQVLANEHPGSGGWRKWSLPEGTGGHVAVLRAISCPSVSLCVAVDAAGEVWSSDNPTGGAGAWRALAIDPGGELLAVSCAAGLWCVAVDSSGNAFATQSATAPTPTWSITPIDAGVRLNAVSCAPSGLCVALDARGTAFASDAPTTAVPGWSETAADPGASPTGVACLAGGVCVGTDPTRALDGRVPAPTVSAATPVTVTDTSVTLAGVVNPNDAVLGACWFEFGPALPYSVSLPCSVLPAPIAGAQTVTAQALSLAPNTLYHYRVLAASATGTGVSADATFTTAVSTSTLLVFPRPSLTGTPAPGQRLSCHPNMPAGAVAQLSYAWLRDLIAIPRETSSTYVVKGQDTGHHLQCQVTATNAGGEATAKSSFVTVPATGVPASAGETSVGRARYSRGRLAVPVRCSASAFSGCRLSLRLTVVERLSGHRVVGFSTAAGRVRASALRNVTVTLAALRAGVRRGASVTLSLALNPTARRLLASRRSIPARLAVSGTVIGVISSTISSQRVVLGAASRKASSRAAHRR